MLGPSGDGHFFLIWSIFLVPKVAFWIWLTVRAGTWGARQGDRSRAENTVIDERMRRVDPTTARSLRDDG